MPSASNGVIENGSVIRAEHTVVIERPIAEVFAYLSNGLNDPAWRDGIVSIKRISDFDGVGAMYEQTVSGPGGTSVRSDYFIDEYEPPQMFSYRVTAGPVRPTGRFDLSETAAGHTTVRSVLEVDTSLATRLLRRMIESEFDAEVRRIEVLKQILEQSPAEPGS